MLTNTGSTSTGTAEGLRAGALPPNPQINMSAWVFRMSWCADLDVPGERSDIIAKGSGSTYSPGAAVTDLSQILRRESSAANEYAVHTHRTAPAEHPPPRRWRPSRAKVAAGRKAKASDAGIRRFGGGGGGEGRGPGWLRKLTDPAEFTGVHKHRFDAEGKGRGLQGRDPILKGTGSVLSRKVRSRPHAAVLEQSVEAAVPLK